MRVVLGIKDNALAVDAGWSGMEQFKNCFVSLTVFLLPLRESDLTEILSEMTVKPKATRDYARFDIAANYTL